MDLIVFPFHDWKKNESEGFRNRDIWSRRDERWVIDNFLIPDFPWITDPS